MQKKRVVILGAGISGLSAAWYLSRTELPLEIIILEKSSRAGGWMHTDHTTGFHFEKGARTFKVDRCSATMQLIAELGLQEEIIWTELSRHPRYLWHEGELHRFPMGPFSLLFSPIARGAVRAILTEWKKPPKLGDETVWEFALRRCNYDVARLFFDPMVVGMFGGDIRKISVRACFPTLKNWEEEYGSMTKGFMAQRKEKKGGQEFSKEIERIPLSAIFSFRCGIEQLPQAIVNQIPATIHYNKEAKEISFNDGHIIIRTENEQFSSDFLFCALPSTEAGQLFEPHAPEISKDLLQIPSQGFSIVNFGYDADVLPVKGFGYLTPIHANEDILGVVFDSSVFSQHNRRQQETRLTIKMEETGRSEEKNIEAALKAIRCHLGISQMPKAISFKRAPRAIPQYGVGHLEKMTEIKNQFRERFPQCQLIGNYLEGISVDQCVSQAKKAVNEWSSNCIEYFQD